MASKAWWRNALKVLFNRLTLPLPDEPNLLLVNPDSNHITPLDRPPPPREILLQPLEEERLVEFVY